MTAAKRRPAPTISDEEEARLQAGIADDPDNPEMTHEELAAMRPAADVLPAELLAALKRLPGQRGPGRRRAKVQVTLRLDPAALDAWKSSGAGWQSRIGELLAREAPNVKRRP